MQRENERQACMTEQKAYKEFIERKAREQDRFDAEEALQGRARNSQLSSYHLLQAEQRRQKAEAEFKAQLAVDLTIQATNDNESKQFCSFAEKAIGEWQADGKNVTPLILELKNYKKRSLL